MEKRTGSGRKPVKRRKVRRRSRRWLRRLTAALLVLLVLGVMATLSLTVLFRTKLIVVQGDTRYAAEQIVAASELQTEVNLFAQDRDTAEAKLLRQLPYLGKVHIAIKLPDQLTISVEETEEKFVFATEQGYLRVDAAGKVLDCTSEAPASFPLIRNAVIQAPEPGATIQFADENTWDILNSLTKAVSQVGLKNVTEIDLTNLYSLRIHYGDAYWIKLGTTGGLEEKLQLAQYVITEKLSGHQSGILDLSAGNGKVVFREEYDSIGVIISPEEQGNTKNNAGSSGENGQN